MKWPIDPLAPVKAKVVVYIAAAMAAIIALLALALWFASARLDVCKANLREANSRHAVTQASLDGARAVIQQQNRQIAKWASAATESQKATAAALGAVRERDKALPAAIDRLNRSAAGRPSLPDCKPSEEARKLWPVR